MFDFSKYTLQELQAITEVLDDLTYKMAPNNPDSCTILYRYFRAAVSVEKAMVEEQAVQARVAGVPAEESEPEQAPDMFGWVGDALDDLCAAGEAIE